jgi:polar amino acid transport system substrate-binding protein
MDYIMLQVVQHQNTGDILIENMPAPNCPENGILVKTKFSLISAGTEKFSVSKAKSSLLERAKKQPEDVKTVLEFVKKEGIVSTFKRVRSALDAYKNLGYSASGVVIESNTDDFMPGDRVAVGGAGLANHAQILAIPKNLAVKIPDDVTYEDAAYATVGSIAMQGIRQTEPQIGESVAVIGLGLIGQITVQLLKANGCRVIGMDIDESLFETARKFGCDEVINSSKDNKDTINAFTRGVGCDSVIITAGTSSNQPIELALDICRKKGKVVIVGAVNMDIPRPPFYTKEIDLRISCSYGPGRYDKDYEDKGIDYPVAFVRWTENRNMQAILDLVSMNKLNVRDITTHKFDVKGAAKAYELIMGESNEDFLGVLLKYPEDATLERTFEIKPDYNKNSQLKLALIGAGSFAKNHLIPPLKDNGVEFFGVAANTSSSSVTTAKHYGFAITSTNGYELIEHKDSNFVVIASRHDSHAKYVLNAIENKKPVFVEKPLCVNPVELVKIDEAVKDYEGRVMVGFNRRFSRSFKEIKDFFKSRTAPMNMIYRVNAGFIPKSSWIQDEEQGGRIIGEACHFIDCMVYLTGALPKKIYAESISANNEAITNNDNVAINIKFTDGSQGTVHYIATGNKSLAKEYCEVHCENSSAIMNNFETVELYRGSNSKTVKCGGTKGIKEEIKEVINSLKNGKNMPISYKEIRAVTAATFAAVESLKKGLPVEIS